MRNPVVLIVDDEALLRMLIADYFSDAGFEVLEAANGAEAQALLSSRPDIGAVVTDVQMPGQPDGFALSRLIRDRDSACAIVVVSGHAAPSQGDLAERACYVQKPYSGDRVVSLVRELLAG